MRCLVLLGIILIVGRSEIISNNWLLLHIATHSVAIVVLRVADRSGDRSSTHKGKLRLAEFKLEL